MLLSGCVQPIFVILQLRLQTTQNLERACQLAGQLAQVLRFELANFLLLISQALASRFHLTFKKLGGVF